MDEPTKRRVIALTCTAMAQHGVVMLLIGALLPAIMGTFRITESAAGLMLGIGSLGSVLGPLLAGLLADRAGAKAVLLVGLGAEVVLLICFGLAPTFLTATAVFVVLSIAAGFIETPVNLVPPMLETRRAGSLMNVVHMFFSVGAFVSPFVAGLILQASGSWRPAYFASAALTVLLLLAMWRSPFPSPAPRAAPSATAGPGRFAALKERPILFGALALFLYVASEFGVSSWIVLYLQEERAFPTLAATSGLSILWLGLLAGRFLNSRLALRHSSRRLVLWSGAGGLATGLALLAARTPAMAYVWLAALGLCMAGMFPNIMAELNGRYPERMGLVTGFLAQAAFAGSVISQPVLGVVAERVGLPAAIAIPAVLMGLVAAAYLGVGAVRAPAAEAPATPAGAKP